MTRADLFREYARIIEMCDAAKLPAITALSCVRITDKKDFDFEELHRAFHEYACDRFDFALCIIENKPVFPGDELCFHGLTNSRKVTISKVINGQVAVTTDHAHIAVDRLSWTAPTYEKLHLLHYSKVGYLATCELAIGQVQTITVNGLIFRIERLK